MQSVCLLLPLIVLVWNPPTKPSSKPTTDLEILFSPNGGCTDRIITEISKAKKSIRVQAYSFTSSRIAKAIVEAKKRGVDCEVILDKSQAKQTYSEATFFYNQGVRTLIDRSHAIAHNKVILIDDKTVITGSFNFTKAAEESNAENLVIIKKRSDIAAKYAKNYALHHAHSEKYQGLVTGGTDPRGPPKAQNENAQLGQPISNPIVYVTKTGTKYHHFGCAYLRSSAISMPLSEALGQYEACTHCGARDIGNPKKGRSDVVKPKEERSSPPVYDGQCTAITKKGTRCKRSARSGGRCWQHGG